MAARSLLILLLAAACSSAVNARGFGAGRSLAQATGTATDCPAHCDFEQPGGCQRDPVTQYFVCLICKPSFVVGPDRNCHCPKGTYYDGTSSCLACAKGSWCPGGPYMTATTTACGTGLTTRGQGRSSMFACVNLPGYFYGLENKQPKAFPCPADTYGPGGSKQTACAPCPPGMVTDGGGHVAIGDCRIPDGFFKTGTNEVAQCPLGTYRSGKIELLAGGACELCPEGVTTLSTGSTAKADCKVTKPGYYAQTFSAANGITAAKLCPQNWYCPGGKTPTAESFNPAEDEDTTTGLDGSIKKCLRGMWTEGLGSTREEQCMVPPGHYAPAGNGDIEACSDGKYRIGWASVTDASASCASCGVGISSEPVDAIAKFKITGETDGAVLVKGSKDACFIVKGQGMIYNAATNVFSAVNCITNQFGVADKAFGLNVRPCRQCAQGLKTVDPPNANDDVWNIDESGTKKGWYSPNACVTIKGYGYEGGMGVKCKVGQYNAEGNKESCKQCPVGTETVADPAQQGELADCKLSPGFGKVGGAIQPCREGFKREGLGPSFAVNTDTECVGCPTKFWSSKPGAASDADCDLCALGYGGDSDCATQCGSSTAPGTYGPAGRLRNTANSNDRACVACDNTPLPYDVPASQLRQSVSPFISGPVTPPGASVSGQCLSEFGQVSTVQGWRISTFPQPLDAQTDAHTVTACADRCKQLPRCMLFNFNYVDDQTARCEVYLAQDPAAQATTTTEVMAIKAYPALNAGAKSSNDTSAKSADAGIFTFWRDNRPLLGEPIGNDLTGKTWPQCLAACWADVDCAAVHMKDVVASQSATGVTCSLRKGEAVVGVWTRTLLRADPDRLDITSIGLASR